MGPKPPPALAADRRTWSTSLTSIDPNRILVRGYPIDELMARVSFADAIYLLLTGDLPSPSISRLIDAMLVSFIDHGATPPPTLSARNAATTGASISASSRMRPESRSRPQAHTDTNTAPTSPITGSSQVSPQ